MTDMLTRFATGQADRRTATVWIVAAGLLAPTPALAASAAHQVMEPATIDAPEREEPPPRSTAETVAHELEQTQRGTLRFDEEDQVWRVIPFEPGDDRLPEPRRAEDPEDDAESLRMADPEDDREDEAPTQPAAEPTPEDHDETAHEPAQDHHDEPSDAPVSEDRDE